MTTAAAFAKPVRSVGGFFAMTLDTFVAMFKPPFAWREFILQAWFVARVSIVPTLMLAIPFTVLLVFTFNILLVEFGAADFSGTGAAIGTVTQIGPIVTVLVVAGAAPPPCAPTWGPAPSAKNSTRCASWASTPFRRSSYRACSPPPWSP